MIYIIFGLLELAFWTVFLAVIATRFPEKDRTLSTTLKFSIILFPLAFYVFKLKVLYTLKLKFERIIDERKFHKNTFPLISVKKF